MTIVIKRNNESKMTPFKLIHYISIKSFLVNNPNSKVVLITNAHAISDWMTLLSTESRFQEFLSSDVGVANHFRDSVDDLWTFPDDYICTAALPTYHCNVVLAKQNVNYCYVEGEDDSIKFSKNSHPDHMVVSRYQFDPFEPTIDDSKDLFIHNTQKSPIYTFSVHSELNYERYLSQLDIEHIMTVDTTFTKLVRRFVADIYGKYDFNF